MTVCSGLQGSEKKTACKALKDQLQLTGFPVLEIKTECPIWKAPGEGTENILCIWATFFSQTINVFLPAPWRPFFPLLFPIFPLGGNCWKTDWRHPLMNRHPDTNTVAITFPKRAAMQSIHAVSWKDIMDFCTPAISLLLRSCTLASFLLIFHITSLFKMFCNSQNYHWIIYLLIC